MVAGQAVIRPAARPSSNRLIVVDKTEVRYHRWRALGVGRPEWRPSLPRCCSVSFENTGGGTRYIRWRPV